MSNLQLSRPPQCLVLNLRQVYCSVVGEVVEHVVCFLSGDTPLLEAKYEVDPLVKVLGNVVRLHYVGPRACVHGAN